MTSAPASRLIPLGQGALTLDALHRLHGAAAPLDFPDEARDAVIRSRAVVDAIAGGDAPVYGINTGFGRLAQRRIAAADLEALQHNLILSHSTGVGEPLPDPVV